MARSRPLVLSKETGEPIYLPWTHEKYEPWKVVILDIETQKRRSKRFFSYQEAKRVAAEFREKLGPSYLVGVVSVQMGYGPPESKVSTQMLVDKNDMGDWWCPYCRTFRRFLYNAWRERRLCEFCQTVETDFHVQVNNPRFWDLKKIERLLSA